MSDLQDLRPRFAPKNGGRTGKCCHIPSCITAKTGGRGRCLPTSRGTPLIVGERENRRCHDVFEGEERTSQNPKDCSRQSADRGDRPGAASFLHRRQDGIASCARLPAVPGMGNPGFYHEGNSWYGEGTPGGLAAMMDDTTKLPAPIDTRRQGTEGRR